MKTVAIVGTGISGMAAAYALRDQARLLLFEKDPSSGGHTCTIDVEGEHPTRVDMGFIVYNEQTYPGLRALFEELNIETHATDMSFSMYNQAQGWVWSATRIFGPRNLLRPGYWQMMREALRFFKDARRDVHLLDPAISLHEYFRLRGYSEWLRDNLVFPMGAAIWSTPLGSIGDFPARSFLRFFENHGLLGVDTHHQWYSVVGGSRTYHQAILDRLSAPVRLPEAVRTVVPRRDGRGVRLLTERDEIEVDAVILATHADQALEIRGSSATELERDLLSKFRYTRNHALLHTDATVMAPNRKYWSAWNFKRGRRAGETDDYRTATVYYMNLLQRLPAGRDYFVSINEFDAVQGETVIAERMFEHPFFDDAAVAAQARLPELNANGPVFFAGSYFKNGFHEDGYQAGTAAARAVSRELDHALMSV